jgi:hypothetical protein
MSNFYFVILSLKKKSGSPYNWTYAVLRSQDSSVGIAKGWMVRVGIPERERGFPLL